MLLQNWYKQFKIRLGYEVEMRKLLILSFTFMADFVSADLYSDFVNDCLDKKMSSSVVIERYKAVVAETTTEIKKMIDIDYSNICSSSCFGDDDIGYSEFQSYLYRLENLCLDNIHKIHVPENCINKLRELGGDYNTKESLFKLVGIDVDLIDG